MNLLDPIYWLTFLYFFVVILLAFFIPGDVVLKRLNVSPFRKIVLSLIVGIVLWTYQGFIFGFLEIRWATYFYLLIFLIIWFKSNYSSVLTGSKKVSLKNVDRILLLILVIGVSIQIIFTFLMGVSYRDVLYFCCGIPDSLYHIALTNSIVNNFPPFEPAMYGTVVKNYHYLANLLQADLIRVFNLPLISTQYQFMGLFMSVLMGLSAIVFSSFLNLGKNFTRFFLFFLYFMGDVTYLLSFLAGRGLNFNVPFLFDSTALWYSPPRVYAVTFLFSGLSFLLLWLKNKNLYLALLAGIIFGVLPGFKIYIGIFAFVGLSFLSLYFASKRNFKFLPIILTATVLAALVYFPVNNQAGGLTYTGTWRFENFISQPDLGLVRMELEREVFRNAGNIPRLIQYGGMYVLFYFIFVFGILNIGLLQTKKTLSKLPKELNIFLVPSIIISLVLGFFFFQKVGGANTSQFLITAEILGTIYAALACSYIVSRLKSKPLLTYAFISLVILLTVPRVINQSKAKIIQTLNRDEFFIDSQELSALAYLKENTSPDSLILSDNLKVRDEKTCYYIAFMSNRRLFICNAYGILSDHGVDVKKREEAARKVLDNLGDSSIDPDLAENNIDYVYTSSLYTYPERPSLKTVFVNGKIRIFKVIR